jgi:hypothetical protein
LRAAAAVCAHECIEIDQAVEVWPEPGGTGWGKVVDRRAVVARICDDHSAREDEPAHARRYSLFKEVAGRLEEVRPLLRPVILE